MHVCLKQLNKEHKRLSTYFPSLPSPSNNIQFYLNYYVLSTDYSSKHLAEPQDAIISKPSLSPTSSSHVISSEAPYAKHHIETTNSWPTQSYQSQQYSLPTNVPLDYHQSYTNSTSKYWS
jgi:hypothetical protein